MATKSYEHGYPTPDWFMTELLSAIDPQKGRWKRAALVARATEVAARGTPWDTTRLTKYLDGDHQTVEFTNALADAIGSPRPFVVPQNAAEAMEIHKTLTRIRGVAATPDRPTRAEVAVQRAEAAAKERIDQRREVMSPHEGSNRSGRTRRSTRSR